MNKARRILLLSALLVLVISAIARLTTPLNESAATVWLLGRDSDCMVTTHSDSQSKSLPCGDVTRHLRGTLHLPSGDRIAIAASPNIPKATIELMSAQLTQWGYLVSGVSAAESFTSNPNP